MSLLEAVVLGVLQGLTEFLPVSSTAHLRIVPALVGWADPGAAFTAVTQFGTLVAVLVYFRRDILRYTRSFLRCLLVRKPFAEHDARLAWWMLLGTIPIIVCGLAFKDFIETSFRSLYVIAGALLAVSLLLIAAERWSSRRRDAATLNLADALLIGMAQACALIPGVSRSGATITAGMFRQLNRAAAAEFSFLLSIPAVALSGFYQLYKLRAVLTSGFGLDLLVATVVAGIVGYLSIEFLLRYLRSHSMYLFILYRVALGLAILAMLWSGQLAA
jgi:undecaprenyl-diphosphatase